MMMLIPVSLGGYFLTIPNINVKHAPEAMITYITSITPSPGRDRGNGSGT